MNNANPADLLTNRQKNICEYGGLFGVLLSLTCLIQHLVAAIPGPVTNPMIPAYTFCIAGFLLLGLQKRIALIWLIISAVLSLIIEWRWMTHYSFSLVVLMLFLYHVIIIVAVYAEQIPRKLKQMKEARQSEEDFWSGKV
ncbi:MAG: hypothetical protein ACT4OJ_10725 [Bacteroidota bacterium]